MEIRPLAEADRPSLAELLSRIETFSQEEVTCALELIDLALQPSNKDYQVLVAVRGGGHNAAGHASCDGGIVIDLTPMKGIHVDPQRRTAYAQGGVTWAEFDRETQVFGLATPGGNVSNTEME